MARVEFNPKNGQANIRPIHEIDIGVAKLVECLNNRGAKLSDNGECIMLANGNQVFYLT